MSLVLSGNAGNVSTPLTATIIGMASAAGLIRVQTSAPHHFATNDYVHIQTITTVIDAYFPITVIDTTHFDLVGSAWTGTGTGTATDASLTPQIQVPTDGDSASLQLSGMLSALQALCDRTQYTNKKLVQRTAQFVHVTSSGNVVIPPWCTHFLILGCGGGGGGGGGMGGLVDVTSGQQFASGGGGAGAQLNFCFDRPNNATSLDVVIGAGGLGGAGSVGGVTPANANPGLHGDSSTVTYHDGLLFGVTFATFYGGAGGGAGSNEAMALLAGAPVYTPGGPPGPGGFLRNAASKRSRFAPGPAQLINIDNAGGTLTVNGGNWPARVYTDPVGHMAYGEGGASMATAGSIAYHSAGVSYDGAPSTVGWAGGAAGVEGTYSGSYAGGAAGGGGGGGPFAVGGVGGNGGNGSGSGAATNGTAGTTTGGGAGGGGGGGGGNSDPGPAGDGAAGGNGGVGAVWILFFTSPGTP